MKEKKRRFNFIDVILLIIIIAVAASLVYVFVSPYVDQVMNKASQKTIRYEIMVEAVSDDIEYRIENGDIVYDTETLNEIGKVVTVEYADKLISTKDAEGNAKTSVYPGVKDIRITVEAKVSVANGIYEINGYAIAAGKDIPFRMAGYTDMGVCTHIREVKGSE